MMLFNESQLIEEEIIDGKESNRTKIIYKIFKILSLYFCILIIFQSKKIYRDQFYVNLDQNIFVKEDNNIKVAQLFVLWGNMKIFMQMNLLNII